jgi:hypothetical protein
MMVRVRTILTALAVALAAAPATANDAGEFAAAIERVAAQYHFTLQALETSGREQTAAEVRLLRQEWQSLVERYAATHQSEFEDSEPLTTTFTVIDTSLVGALIVIDIGSRDAAREALKPVGDTLARLRERTERR